MKKLPENYQKEPGKGFPHFAVGPMLLSAFLTLSPSLTHAGHAPSHVLAVQQSKGVTGQVLDEYGEPLIGVTVRAGKGKATITDANGNFTLNVPQGTTLTLSYTGYKQMKTTKGGTITMQPDVLGLQEVVAVGYGTMKKADLTGAVSSVKKELITMTPSSNPMEALQGRVSGLDITKSSGQAGSGIDMQLRGNRSITASGSPLVLIDGMEGDINTLNPNDIENIEVLKDASSTAVYGSSGANGVILVTTKKAQAGKLNVNFNTYIGWNGWSTLPKMNDAVTWVRTRYIAQKEAGVVMDDDIETKIREEALSRGETIDWVDAMMQTGSTQNYSFSVNGGTQKTQAYFSLNYSKEIGQYKNDEYNVYSGTVRINHDVNKWFSTGLHAQGAYTSREQTSSKLDKVMKASPFGTLYDDNGNLKPYPINDDNGTVNLLLNQDRDVYRNHPTSFKIYAQPYIRIKPIKGLTWESRLSLNLGFSNSRQFIGYGSYQFYDKAGTGAVGAPHSETSDYTSASLGNNNSWSYTWENILTYHFNIAQDHDFTVTGVTTYNNSENESFSLSNTGISTNTYYWTNMGASTGNNKTLASSFKMGKTMGYVARINYSYLSRYLLAASIRYDGNSKLAKDVRWNAFPAVSAGWRISDEPFMASTQNWLSNLKLRIGYGETGAAGISAYDSWAILQQGNIGLGDQVLTSYTFGQNLANAELTWERSRNTNIGIDAAFLNGRIDLTLDYYITNTSGVIWKQNVPITNGGFNASNNYTVNKNIAKTRNSGIEITLNTRNIQTKDFLWQSTITFAKNKEKVTDLGEGAAEFITNGSYTLHVGDPIRSYRAYKIDGVWQYGEEADAAVFGKLPGDLKVNVPNMRKISDGVWEKSYPGENGEIQTVRYTAENRYSVNDNDKQMIGHSSPDWSLGFQNTFTWKGIDLSIYMYWRHGQMFYYDPITWYSSSGGSFPAHFNYWTSTNPSNDFPALNSNRNWKDDSYYTSLAYVDGSFFKIKNITLGYTLPQNICKKIRLQSLRIYGTITNPLVHASSHLLEGYDPEMSGSLDFPLTKQLVFGLNVSF